MKKTQKNPILYSSVCSTERKFILDSLLASFRIEGICIPRERAEVIYARVNEKLKKQLR